MQMATTFQSGVKGFLTNTLYNGDVT